MKPKLKAEELVEKYTESISYYGQHAREHREDVIECAKIAVDEIIEQYIKFSYWHDRVGKEGVDFWQEVKNELNKM